MLWFLPDPTTLLSHSSQCSIPYYCWWCNLMSASKMEAHKTSNVPAVSVLIPLPYRLDSYGNTNCRKNISLRKRCRESLLMSKGLGHCIHIHPIANEIYNLNGTNPAIRTWIGRIWLIRWVEQIVGFLSCFLPTEIAP